MDPAFVPFHSYIKEAVGKCQPDVLRRSRWQRVTRRPTNKRSHIQEKAEPYGHVRMGITEGPCELRVMIWKMPPLLGTHCFLERSHLHVSNLAVVDAVGVKGYNKGEILSINTLRSPFHIFFSK